MKGKRLFTILVLFCVVLFGGQALAAGTGFYLGGSLGQTTLEDDLSATLESFKEKDTSYRLFGGYRLGILPVVDIAGEAGYRDFGNPDKRIAGQTFEAEMTGYDLSALAIFPIGPIDLYLRGGVLRYGLDSSYAGDSSSYDGNAALYGIGIGARILKIGLRAEYEIADVDRLDKAYMYWVSAYYMF